MAPDFIQSLAAQGLLKPPDAERIGAWVSRHHDPVGVIAVEHGLILGRQIDDVLGRQRELGLRFGQTCVEMGHMSRANLAALLEIQGWRATWRVAETLLLSGLLSSDQILRAYAAFVLEDSGRGAAGLSAAA